MEELELKLVEGGWVTYEQLLLAKQDALKIGKSVWASLVRLGYVSEEGLSIFFAQESGLSFVRISDYKLSDEVIRLLSEDYCRQNTVIPLFKIKDTLFVACSNPLDTVVVDNLAKLSGCNIELLLSSSHSIQQALDLYWGPEEKSFKMLKFMFNPVPLKGLSFWRESERIDLNIPVNLAIEDESVVLHYSSPIEGYSRNISSNGTAVALEVFLFLPKGINVSLEFRPKDSPSSNSKVIKVKGEIVYSRMEKGQRYLLGIRFTQIEEEARQRLLKLID